MLSNCGATEELWASMESKEIKPVNPRQEQPWIFIGRTGAEAESQILWSPDAKVQLIGQDCDAWKDWGQEDKGVTEDEMVDGMTNSMDMSLSQLQGIGKDREVWSAAVRGIAESQTRWSNRETTTNASPQIISDPLWLTIASQRWALQLHQILCEGNVSNRTVRIILSSRCQVSIKATVRGLCLMWAHLTVPNTELGSGACERPYWKACYSLSHL